MKQILFSVLSAMLILTSCSKNDDAKVEEANTVTIGGKSYPTVTIGTQIWTSVNYNGDGGVNYNNGSNDANYGKLYTLAEAKAISLPSGWRLPSKGDAEKLFLSIGATKDSQGEINGSAEVNKKLKSTKGWVNNQGDNSSGFNAYPSGEFDSEFFGKGTLATFWTSTQVATAGTNFHHIFGIWNTNETSTIISNEIGVDLTAQATTSRFALRFVKDK